MPPEKRFLIRNLLRGNFSANSSMITTSSKTVPAGVCRFLLHLRRGSAGSCHFWRQGLPVPATISRQVHPLGGLPCFATFRRGWRVSRESLPRKVDRANPGEGDRGGPGPVVGAFPVAPVPILGCASGRRWRRRWSRARSTPVARCLWVPSGHRAP